MYQATIIWEERNYELGRWIAHNRRHSIEALARKELNWSVLDPHLISEASPAGHCQSQGAFCLWDGSMPLQLGLHWPGTLNPKVLLLSVGWIHASSARPSLARHSQSQGAPSVCGKIIQGNTAPRTRTIHGSVAAPPTTLHCSQLYGQQLQHGQQLQPHTKEQLHTWSSDNSTRADASRPSAATPHACRKEEPHTRELLASLPPSRNHQPRAPY